MPRAQRKQLKQRARWSVKQHYGVMLSVCLLAILLGTEFTGSLDFLKVQTPTDVKVEREVLEESEFGIEQNNVWKVVTEVLAGNLEQGTQDADRLTEEAIRKSEDSGETALGRTNGVLANLVNDLTSGLFFVKFVKGFYRLGFSQGAILFIVSVFVLTVGIGFWFLVKNVYRAAGRRVFLECRTYEKVTLQRLLFFLRSRRWMNACVNMLMQYVLYILWSLTIVGAAVKRYSYFMVPFIVAENPEISWRDSIKLSRRMMDGHKWECFLLELTFVPWKLLGIATLGLTDFFYVNAYKTATLAEYYARLRRLVLDAALGIPTELPAPPYIQVLGARKTALSRLKQAALPAGTSLADLARSGAEAARISELHSKAVDFSALCRVKTQPMGLAFTTKPVVV